MDTTLFGLLLTLLIFLFVSHCQQKIGSKLLNPILVSSLTISIILKIFRIDLDQYFSSANFLTALILPASISLALSLYNKKDILVKHYKIILKTTIITASIHTLLIVFLTSILKIDIIYRYNLYPKSITTAAATELSSLWEADSGITAAIVIITGVIGTIISQFIHKHQGNDLARGLALGLSAHAVGTAEAQKNHKEEGSLASLGLILHACLTLLIAQLLFLF